MQRTDVVAGTACAALGAYALVTALNLAFLSSSGTPGPGLFPTVLSALLVLFGLLLAVSTLRRPSTTARRTAGADAGDAGDAGDVGATDVTGAAHAADAVRDPGQRARVLRASTVWVCFAVAATVLNVVGFVLTSALLIAVALFGAERKLGWRPLLVAVLVPVGSYELFVHLLAIPLPVGLIALGPFSS